MRRIAALPVRGGPRLAHPDVGGIMPVGVALAEEKLERPDRLVERIDVALLATRLRKDRSQVRRPMSTRRGPARRD
jgi:hypothetical protein